MDKVSFSAPTARRYHLAILSNQGGIALQPSGRSASSAKGGGGVKADPKRLADFKTKVGYVLPQLDRPITLLAATARDRFRKPRPGMWAELLEELDLDDDRGGDGMAGPDLGASFFVGDAGGRAAEKGIKADHSCVDR